jgi:hypothetical protein
VENAAKAVELSVEAVALDPLKAEIYTIHTIALLRNGDLARAPAPVSGALLSIPANLECWPTARSRSPMTAGPPRPGT